MYADRSSDAELLARVARGDEPALRELVERHSAWLLIRLQRRTADADLAAEALQDTFVALWRGAGKYRGDGDVGAWLWGIAIRQLISRLRKRPAPVPIGEALAAYDTTVHSAEEELLVAVEHGDMGAALRRLSPELRRALQATTLDGLTTKEAALLLGVPQNTIKSRVRLAKRQLRASLLPDSGERGWR